MQRNFCDVGGYIASMGYNVSPARSIIPNVRRVRDAVAAWGGSIVLTREGHRPDLSDLPPIKAWRSRLGGVEIYTRWAVVRDGQHEQIAFADSEWTAGQESASRAKSRWRHLIRLNVADVGVCHWRPPHWQRPPNPHSAC